MRVLFVCTANSARSQMAEAIARHLQLWPDVKSAGLKPSGVNPLAIEVMAEMGVDMSSHTSKMLTPELLDWADLVVTLCGDARDSCPVLPRGKRHEHWGFADPAQVSGSYEQKLGAFRAARNAIKDRLVEEAISASSSGPEA